MNSNNINKVMNKLEKQIPKNCQTSFRKNLAKATDDCVNKLLCAPIKKKGTTLALSIFLGGFGVDRFYLGNPTLGVAKILMMMIITPFSSNTGYGTDLCIISALWYIVDIFLTCKKAKKINYGILESIVKQNQIKENSSLQSNNRGNSNTNKLEQARTAVRNFAAKFEQEDNCKNIDNEVLFSMSAKIGERSGKLGIMIDVQESKLIIAYTFGRVHDQNVEKAEMMAEAYNARHNNSDFEIQIPNKYEQLDREIMLFGGWNYVENAPLEQIINNRVAAIIKDASSEESKCFFDITYPD